MAAELPLKIGVVGAGAMGAGIAETAAASGIPVILTDLRQGAAASAIAAILARAAKRVSSGKLSQGQYDALAGALIAADSPDALADCDLVVEAIIEDPAAKQALFARLEDLLAPGALIASNTSSLPIGVIARDLKHPERFAGLHFFNPVPLMKLVEVIPGPRTSRETMERLLAVARHLGKEPVEVRDTPGFLVNHGGRAYPTEALMALQEGVASPAEIDAIMRDCCDFRMGPFELMDLTGMDVNFTVCEFLHQSYFAEPRLRSTTYHRYLLQTGQLGRKTQQGFYAYHDGAEQPSADFISTAAPAQQVVLAEDLAELRDFAASLGCRVAAEDDGTSPVLAFPVGEDLAGHAARLGLPATRLVAVDLAFDSTRRVVLMTTVGADPAVRDAVAAAVSASGRRVTAIADSTGFVAQRIVAAVANLGCEMAQMGLAAPGDIDKAMRLAMNYPCGPLEWVDRVGAARMLTILRNMQALSGDDRYRPSAWLRRRATLGLDIRSL
ncbi:3-hydroxyacyl-CoA dehydrogenase [Pseudomonas sp. GX19020]|uniref:3-hydroxyacyl-CoA dehydrogenase n=1 Tax=Pseudomonas sp. GX19020 TaxID=2942277 RepID=UPI00201898C4|nr:3-hydroxyacyl-CoA dehydrogenase [Pseudomonas sp. GX19020]MCL4067424.1 3-hydroxyacyl-CoA dehydrogenase [Pseudomonas sp. GX19020]